MPLLPHQVLARGVGVSECPQYFLAGWFQTQQKYFCLMQEFLTLLLQLSWRDNFHGCLPDSHFPISGFTLFILSHLTSITHFHTKENGNKTQQAFLDESIILSSCCFMIPTAIIVYNHGHEKLFALEHNT